MSGGFPDFQAIQQWTGTPLAEGSNQAIGAGTIDTGVLQVGSWASILVWAKATTHDVSVTVTQTIGGGPAALALAQTFNVPAGTTKIETVILDADQAEVVFTGAAAGTVLDYAVLPSNTTTGASVSTGNVTVQHNDVAVGTEPALDFEDAGANVWAISDDGANSRVKITPPKFLTGRISAAAGITSGTGFTVAHPGTGSYTITYNVAFAATPLVLITLRGAYGFVQLAAEAAGSFNVQFVNTGGGVNVDVDFGFLAIAIG